jgi:MFS transporter, MHS family, metabolite:H+ symporter
MSVADPTVTASNPIVIDARALRRASTASIIGSIIEYYDFALYGLASALIFGRIFFPALGTSAGLIASFATLALGFLVRPVGGIVFGVLGDKLGRRFVLVTTVALMGGSSALIGVLPTGAQVGVVAPLLLVLLRLLQGFGAGAEQAGAATLMAEYAPPARRGWYAALPFIGIPGGMLIASLAYIGLTLAPEEALLGGLWRIPFLASIVLLVVALIIRLRMEESPTFVRLEAREQISRRPLRELTRDSWRSVLRGIGFRMAENGNSYLYYTLSLSFVTSMGVSASSGTLAVIVGCVIGIVAVPFFGWLSDRVGRLPVIRWACFAMILFAFPSWWLLSLGNPAIAIATIAIGIGVGIYSMLGPEVSLLPELFGNRNRYLGVAVSREFSSAIAGGIAPLVGAALLAATGNAWWPIACYVVVLSAFGFVTSFVTPETRGRDLTLLAEARTGDRAASVQLDSGTH